MARAEGRRRAFVGLGSGIKAAKRVGKAPSDSAVEPARGASGMPAVAAMDRGANRRDSPGGEVEDRDVAVGIRAGTAPPKLVTCPHAHQAPAIKAANSRRQRSRRRRGCPAPERQACGGGSLPTGPRSYRTTTAGAPPRPPRFPFMRGSKLACWR